MVTEVGNAVSQSKLKEGEYVNTEAREKACKACKISY